MNIAIKRGRWALAGLIAVAVVVFLLARESRHTVKTFCTTGLAVVVVDGTPVALQDQGPPGRDQCDIDPAKWTGSLPVLTYSCKITYPPGYTGHRIDATRVEHDHCGERRRS
jgi:hypothetical protein